jgi:hypothetical protein
LVVCYLHQKRKYQNLMCELIFSQSFHNLDSSYLEYIISTFWIHEICQSMCFWWNYWYQPFNNCMFSLIIHILYYMPLFYALFKNSKLHNTLCTYYIYLAKNVTYLDSFSWEFLLVLRNSLLMGKYDIKNLVAHGRTMEKLIKSYI